MTTTDRTDTATSADPRYREQACDRSLVADDSTHATLAVPGVSAVNAERNESVESAYNWPVMGWIVGLHLGALAAPFFFTWQGLTLMFLLHWLTGCIGICLGYHRLLTHSGFETFRPVRHLLAFIGGLAGEGCAMDWVAAHRKHHALSDKEGDPHSPNDGAWWSHMGWLGSSYYGLNNESFARRWAPDLWRDPVMRFLGRIAIPAHFVFGGLLFLAGYLAGGATLGASFVFWGMFVRLVFLLHSTWLVNSASHMWGYRNYETTDNSRNNWWVAALSYGEGWHNNHHAYPRMAKHGHRWWEFDLTFLTIRLLRFLGLVWNVVDYRHKTEATG